MANTAQTSRIAADTVMSMLIRHEEAVEKLYRLYAGKFPELAAFWNHLAAQEKGHAGLLHQLNVKLKEGTLRFSAERFNLETIRISAEFVEHQIDIANRETLTVLDALASAIRTEDQSIEVNAFGMFCEANVDPEICELFTRIREQEREHRQAIEGKTHEVLAPAPSKPGFFRRIFGK